MHTTFLLLSYVVWILVEAHKWKVGMSFQLSEGLLIATVGEVVARRGAGLRDADQASPQALSSSLILLGMFETFEARERPRVAGRVRRAKGVDRLVCHSA